MADAREQEPPPRRRRAVGPPGATTGRPPDVDLGSGQELEPAPAERDDEERLTRDRPPHHDRGV